MAYSVIMSTIGFREACDNSIEVSIDGDLIVKVASLAGLTEQGGERMHVVRVNTNLDFRLVGNRTRGLAEGGLPVTT